MMPCIICARETDGSVGAAGIRWRSLCQPCKDAEDHALEESLTATGAIEMSIGPISDYDYWKLSNGPYEDEEPDEGFSDPRYDLFYADDDDE